MRWLLSFLFIFVAIHAMNADAVLRAWANRLQKRCAEGVHRDSEHSPLVESYLCGTELPPGKFRDLFSTTGLYHLIVVSGSHLLLLVGLLRYFRCGELWITMALAIYAVLTGLAHPVLRSFLQRLMISTSQMARWNWSQALCALLAGPLCLLIFPEWIRSTALQLSFGCSLAMALGMQTSRGSLVKGSILAFLLLTPLLAGWAQVHPLGILMNLLLAPILALLLWLICGLWLLWPVPGDFFFRILLRGFAEAPPLMPFNPGPALLTPTQRWIYILVIALTLGLVSVHRGRHRKAPDV